MSSAAGIISSQLAKINQTVIHLQQKKPDPFTAEQLQILEEIKTGASSSWILAAAAVIFFMQLGFVLLEAGGSRRQHWSSCLIKNCLDVISGVFGFWIVGFGLAFGPSDPTGFIGMSDSTYTVSAHFDRYTVEDLNLKWIFQFAFANTSSAIVSGLLMERCRIETYGAFSFIITLFIYPIVAGWEWNPAGWLAVKGFHDFAGCAAIHTLGGICGLVGSIMCGPRYNLFQGVQFPFLFRETREAKNKKFLEEQLEKLNKIEEMPEIKELVEFGTITNEDVTYIKAYAIQEFKNPNTELEEESSMWLSIGTFILWLGWFFFNGGSAYTLYNKALDPAKIIQNTILAAGASGATAFFVKKPIQLWYMSCCRKEGQKYQAIRASLRYDTGSLCNGILAGLVAITAPCDACEPWAAVCIGIIAGFVYSFFSKLIVALNIDDPLEAASVHYANGIWGLLSCFVFDSSKGFVSGNTSAMGPYVGVQIYGSICVTLWGIVMAFLYFAVCSYFDWLRYHPLYEYMGAHRLKMGDITQKFLTEIRQNHRPSTADGPLKYEETDGKLQVSGNSRVRVVPSQDNNA